MIFRRGEAVVADPEELTAMEAAKVKKEEEAATAAEANDALLSKKTGTPKLIPLESE